MITIDGHEISAPEGENLLKAAWEAGIDIPGLCFHPRLSPTASCRLCMVKINGNSRLVPACTTEVTAGLEVTAFDDDLEAWRRKLLDLLLSEHKCNCINCDQAGNCKLQELGYRYGLIGLSGEKFRRVYRDVAAKLSRFPGLKFLHPDSQHKKSTHSFTEDAVYSGNPSDCIRCGFCVEACPMGLNPVLVMEAEGDQNHELLERLYPTDCITCGLCSYVCPVQISLPEYLRRAAEMKKRSPEHI